MQLQMVISGRLGVQCLRYVSVCSACKLRTYIDGKILTGREPWCGEDPMLHLQGQLEPHHPPFPAESGILEVHWQIMTLCWDIRPSKRLTARRVKVALNKLIAPNDT